MVEVGWHTGWNKVTTTLRDSEDTTRRHFCKWSALRPITDVGYVFDGIADSAPDPGGILSQKCKFLVRISDVRASRSSTDRSIMNREISPTIG